MSRYLGVLSQVHDSTFLKRAALLFDVVICNEVEPGVELPPSEGFIRTGAAKMIAPYVDDPPNEESQQLAHEIANVLCVQADVLETAAANRQFAEVSREAVVSNLYDCVARIYVEPLQRIFADDVVLPLLRGTSLGNMSGASRATIIRVVLNLLPVPSATTPWQAILDWRADEEAVEKYAQLRAWIARSARQQVNSADIHDELAAMLAAYQRYMSIQHKKLKLGRLEAVIVPVAEACEDLMRLKLSSAVKRLCSFFKEDVQLLEAECRAPGREVAYIAVAQENFGRRSA